MEQYKVPRAIFFISVTSFVAGTACSPGSMFSALKGNSSSTPSSDTGNRMVVPADIVSETGFHELLTNLNSPSFRREIIAGHAGNVPKSVLQLAVTLDDRRFLDQASEISDLIRKIIGKYRSEAEAAADPQLAAASKTLQDYVYKKYPDLVDFLKVYYKNHPVSSAEMDDARKYLLAKQQNFKLDGAMDESCGGTIDPTDPCRIDLMQRRAANVAAGRPASSPSYSGTPVNTNVNVNHTTNINVVNHVNVVAHAIVLVAAI